MNELSSPASVAKHIPEDVAYERHCFGCEVYFWSERFAERVYRQCKSSNS